MTEKLREFAASTGEVMKVPAFKGRLGGVDFFVIMLSFSKLARYIEMTDPNLPAPQRENRRPRPERYAEIAKYILDNPRDYRFSALTCTYGKNGTKKPLDWRPVDPDAPEGSTEWMIGELTLNQGDPLIIVDGQHRLGAIKQAINSKDNKNPALRNETIPIVLFPYISMEMNQQLFSDLNRTAKKTSKSLDVFFNRRDVENRVVQKVVDKVSVFKERVDVENISVAKSADKVFTLAGVYQATTPMIKAAYIGGLVEEELKGENKLENEKGNEDEYAEFLVDAWEFIAEQFPEWGKVATGEMNIAQHRQNYLHWNSGVLSSIGEFVGFAMGERSADWKEVVKTALAHPDNGNWRRDARYWGGIILAGDQVLPRSAVRIQLIAYLKLKSGLSLREREKGVLANLAPQIQERIGFSQ
jgi:DNA sulfur modification protein DndB